MKLKAGFVVLLLLLLLAQAEAATFRLEPGDPHWIKKEDPNGWLYDRGEYWESNAVGKGTRPKIYFKLPEVASSTGMLAFYYAKDKPGSMGWDSLRLYASTSQAGPYVKLWASPEWGPVTKKYVVVVIPAGYQYLYFHLVDGDLNWETLRLWKQMDIIVQQPQPTPTPTPPPTTPTPTPTPIPIPIPSELLWALVGAGIVALIVLVARWK